MLRAARTHLWKVCPKRLTPEATWKLKCAEHTKACGIFKPLDK